MKTFLINTSERIKGCYYNRLLDGCNIEVSHYIKLSELSECCGEIESFASQVYESEGEYKYNLYFIIDLCELENTDNNDIMSRYKKLIEFYLIKTVGDKLARRGLAPGVMRIITVNYRKSHNGIKASEAYKSIFGNFGRETDEDMLSINVGDGCLKMEKSLFGIESTKKSDEETAKEIEEWLKTKPSVRISATQRAETRVYSSEYKCGQTEVRLSKTEASALQFLIYFSYLCDTEGGENKIPENIVFRDNWEEAFGRRFKSLDSMLRHSIQNAQNEKYGVLDLPYDVFRRRVYSASGVSERDASVNTEKLSDEEIKELFIKELLLKRDAITEKKAKEVWTDLFSHGAEPPFRDSSSAESGKASYEKATENIQRIVTEGAELDTSEETENIKKLYMEKDKLERKRIRPSTVILTAIGVLLCFVVPYAAVKLSLGNFNIKNLLLVLLSCSVLCLVCCIASAFYIMSAEKQYKNMCAVIDGKIKNERKKKNEKTESFRELVTDAAPDAEIYFYYSRLLSESRKKAEISNALVNVHREESEKLRKHIKNLADDLHINISDAEKEQGDGDVIRINTGEPLDSENNRKAYSLFSLSMLKDFLSVGSDK